MFAPKSFSESESRLSYFISDSVKDDDIDDDEESDNGGGGLVEALALLESQEGRARLGVSDLSVGRATLEQVFMAMVRGQVGGWEKKRGFLFLAFSD